MKNNFKICPFTKFILWCFLGLIICIVGISNVYADTFIPSSKLQYYEGYSENNNTGNYTFHENGYSYGSNITPPLTPGYSEHPYAISLILNGTYYAGNTYIFQVSLYANLSNNSSFKFYYPDIRYMAWYSKLSYSNDTITCNFDMVVENSRFDITCSYQPSVNSNSAIIGFVNYDYINNGYLTYDDLGTYFKWDNISIQLYSDSSGAIIEQNQTIINQNQEIINNIDNINDTINDDNVDSSSWASFFNNFTTNTFGLTSIITAPLNLIQSLTSTTCTDLQLPLPYLQNKYLTLPCMNTIYSQYFGTFFTLYQTITYGIIAYWVCVRIFNLVKDFKNPDHDEIEVVDL